jgi:hypothetical protein
VSGVHVCSTVDIFNQAAWVFYGLTYKVL